MERNLSKACDTKRDTLRTQPDGPLLLGAWRLLVPLLAAAGAERDASFTLIASGNFTGGWFFGGDHTRW